MPAPSLTHMARRACVKNIKLISDVGDTPYEVVRPVLLRIENPEHLRVIEQNSPHICGADAEVWREFIKRDIPNWQTKPHEPKNPTSWYKVYRKLLKESLKEVDQDAQLLKATLDDIKSQQAQKKAKKVELNVVKVPKGLTPTAEVIKLPRNSTFFAREQNTKDLKPEYVRWEREHGRIEGHFLHPRLRAADKAKMEPVVKSKLAQFRKEAKAMTRFSRTELSKVGSGRDMTPKPASPKVAIPPAMLREYQKPASPMPIDPTIKPAAAFNPKKRRIEHVESPEQTDDLERREKRLRTLTRPPNTRESSSPRPQIVRVPRLNRQPSSSTSDSTHVRPSNSPPPSQSSPPPSQSSPSSQLLPTISQPSISKTAPSPTARATTSSPLSNEAKRFVRVKRAPANPFMPQKRQRVC